MWSKSGKNAVNKIEGLVFWRDPSVEETRSSKFGILKHQHDEALRDLMVRKWKKRVFRNSGQQNQQHDEASCDPVWSKSGKNAVNKIEGLVFGRDPSMEETRSSKCGTLKHQDDEASRDLVVRKWKKRVFRN